MNNNKSLHMKTITFGGGCFWCIESCFNRLKGVEKAISGYAGGHKDNPTYQEVCTGETGHAEVVQLTYDPLVISYEQLLDVFFFLHDPTQINRQGNDIGTQYRSIIFYNDEEEKKYAEEKISSINQSEKYQTPVVTELEPLKHFWPAETYHQGYFNANPNQPYCSAVVGPKIQKFITHFSAMDWVKPD
ncbi:MAG: peptide-methionine (S)-S-oxide reductase MsrA [Bacteroidetes bacterium]|nr:peptide-methionine (S)-S-oxide reductase MsrA [Bacteroidota bacterium]